MTSKRKLIRVTCEMHARNVKQLIKLFVYSLRDGRSSTFPFFDRLFHTEYFALQKRSCDVLQYAYYRNMCRLCQSWSLKPEAVSHVEQNEQKFLNIVSKTDKCEARQVKVRPYPTFSRPYLSNRSHNSP